MSLESDIFAGINTIKAADTGSGGLANTSGNAYVRAWYREDDPVDRDSDNWPMIRVDTSGSDEQDKFDNGLATCVIRMSITVKRDYDQTFTLLDAVVDRVRKVFHTATIAQTTDWAFSPLYCQRVFKGPTTSNETRRIVEFTLAATRKSAVA